MDCSDLADLGLVIEGGKKVVMRPKFKPKLLKYSASVANGVEKLTIDTFADDADAYVSVVGDLGGRSVPLKVGHNEVVVVCEAADRQKESRYVIAVRRQPLDDATLMNISLGGHRLVPHFEPRIVEYSAALPAYATTVPLKCIRQDKLIGVKIDDTEGLSKEINLRGGETVVTIDTLAADKTTTGFYRVTLFKDRVEHHLELADDAVAPQCPLCLCLPHRPAHALPDPEDFCSECLTMLLRIEKEAPLSRRRLTAVEAGARFATSVRCPWAQRGCHETASVEAVGAHVSSCSFRPRRCARCSTIVNATDLEEHQSSCKTSCPDCAKPLSPDVASLHAKYCTACDGAVAFDQKEPTNPKWTLELAALRVSKETDAAKLNASGAALERKAAAAVDPNAAAELLRTAAKTYACALAVPALSKSSEFRARLGHALELQYNLAETETMKKPAEDDGGDEDELVDQGSAQQMADDIQALAKMHGVGADGKPEEILLAIDTEYRSEPNSFRQDYLQSLYAFKSKQIHGASLKTTALGEGANLVLLSRAAEQYCDAAALDPNNAAHHFAAGRTLAAAGKPEEAMRRFQAVIGLRPAHPHARLFLALTALLCGPDTKIEGMDVVNTALLELEHFMAARMLQKLGADGGDECTTGLRPGAVIVKGVVATATALVATKRFVDCIRLCHAGLGLTRSLLFPMTNRASDLYVILESATLALHLSVIKCHWAMDSKPEAAKVGRQTASLSASLCTRDSVGMRVQAERLLKCALKAAPRDPSIALQLGHLLVRRADSILAGGPKASELLDDARRCFRTILALEGGGAGAVSASELLSAQSWWTEVILPTPAVPKAAKVAAPGKVRAGAASRRGGLPGRAPAAAAASRAPARGGRNAPVRPIRGADVNKGGAARNTKIGPARGSAATPFRKNEKPLPAIGSSKKTAGTGSRPNPRAMVSKAAGGKKGGACGRASTGTAAVAKGRGAAATRGTATVKSTPLLQEKSADPLEVVAVTVNPMCAYSARIGLARSNRLTQKLAGADADLEEQIDTLCRDAIKLNPDKHDAYLELYEAKVTVDHEGAIAILDSIPVKQVPDFEDAFVHGEAMRLLMKHKMFGDERLERHLVGYAKVNGFSAIDKEVQILDEAYKYSKMLMRVFAAVNNKKVDDPELVDFFKMKCWL